MEKQTKNISIRQQNAAHLFKKSQRRLEQIYKIKKTQRKEDNWIMLNYKHRQQNYVHYKLRMENMVNDKKAKNRFVYFELFETFL